MPNFGERLFAARKTKGITQQHLADLCGLTKGSISQYELGNNSISGDNVFPLADALGVSARWLITGAGGDISVDELPASAPKVAKIARHIAVLPDEKIQALVVLLGIKL